MQPHPIVTGHPFSTGGNLLSPSNDFLSVPTQDTNSEFLPSLSSLHDESLRHLWKGIFRHKSAEVVEHAILLAQVSPQTLKLFYDLAKDRTSPEVISHLCPILATIPNDVWVAVHRLMQSTFQQEFTTRLRQIQQQSQDRLGPRTPSTLDGTNSEATSPSNYSRSVSSHTPSHHHNRHGSDRSVSSEKLRYFCPFEDCKHKPDGYSKLGYWRNHMLQGHRSFVDEYSDWEDRYSHTLQRRPSNRRHKRKPTQFAQLLSHATASQNDSPETSQTGEFAAEYDHVASREFSTNNFNNDADTEQLDTSILAPQTSHGPQYNPSQTTIPLTYPSTPEPTNQPLTPQNDMYWAQTQMSGTMQFPTTPFLQLTPPVQAPGFPLRTIGSASTQYEDRMAPHHPHGGLSNQPSPSPEASEESSAYQWYSS